MTLYAALHCLYVGDNEIDCVFGFTGKPKISQDNIMQVPHLFMFHFIVLCVLA